VFELICVLTLGVAAVGALWAFASVRDPLHPAVFLAPLFGYFYGLWPVLLNREGALHTLFPGGLLEFAALIFLLSIAAMYAGLLHGLPRLKKLPPPNLNPFGAMLSPAMSGRLRNLALFMGILSVASFAIQLNSVGGLIEAYSRSKGGGHTDSGYINEAILLSFPALLVLALAVYSSGRRIRITHVFMALFIASPHLMQGILGGRRGPLFLVLCIMFFAWFLARGVRPRLVTILATLAMISFAVVLISSQRKYVYLGSEQSIELSRAFNADGLAHQDVDSTNSYVTAAASIVAADYYKDYHWGYRYFVTFVIRPIPKQVWPTKYQDMGATWLNAYGDSPENTRFSNILGFSPPAGSAAGSIADGFGEFSWFVILMFYLIGRAFAASYALHRREGGFWSAVLYMMLALSIYLPTQSFSAWLHRLSFMSVFAYLFWRMTVGPVRKVRSRIPPYPRPLHPRRL
jgi:oligosaccharide repeat unit polymerase